MWRLLLISIVISGSITLASSQARSIFKQEKCPRSDKAHLRRCHERCASHRDCHGANDRCECDGDCGMSCVNANAPCRPVHIAHGRVVFVPENQFGSIATYKCDRGYTLYGRPARVCQGDRNWSGSEPRCEPDHESHGDKQQDCGPPPTVVRAHHNGPRQKASYAHGHSLHYSCDKGFTKDKGGVTQAWCVRGGTWVGPDMNCSTFGCSTPPGIKNGEVKMLTQNVAGGRVRYTCDPGYFLNGKDQRTCESDGTWEGHAPRCEPVVCGPPPAVSNAKHDGQHLMRFDIGTKLKYTCKHGYYREGSRRAICTGPRGVWTGANMTCKARHCKKPGGIPNGRLSDGYRFTFPTRITYNCNVGYKLVGKHFQECQASGEWSGEVPRCEPVECEDLVAPLSGTKIGDGHTFGTVIKFECNTGYDMEGSAERKCQANGQWMGKDTTCRETDCGLPAPFYNGELDGHRTTVGAVYFFRCFENTTFNGTSYSASCLSSGQWSEPIPHCLGKCTVGSIENGTIKYVAKGEMLEHGTLIEPRCFNGLVLDDARPVLCNNGTWSAKPKCVPAPCNSPPPQLQHGHRVFFSLSHGDKARYYCVAGYKLIDKKNQYLTCKFGKWVGNRPMCEQHNCPHPGTLPFGTIYKVGVKGHFPFSPYISIIGHGERLIYECDRDHILVGARGAACVNGMWSPGSKPKCERSRHPVFNRLWRPIQERFRHPQYY